MATGDIIPFKAFTWTYGKGFEFDRESIGASNESPLLIDWTTGGAIDGRIEDMGGGWYRFVTTVAANDSSNTFDNLARYTSEDDYPAVTLDFAYQHINDWHTLPTSIQQALNCLVYDSVIPEFVRAIVTNERYYRIEHNGSFYHTIVDTEQFVYDDFSCGYDPETRTICVHLYEDASEQKYDLPPTIVCKACGRDNSTFGLIGNEIVCDCGHLNKVV